VRRSISASLAFAGAVLLACGARAGTADQAELAWLRDGRVEMRVLSSDGATTAMTATSASARVPLGSLWKLFVFAWLTDTQAQEPEYVCANDAQNEEDRYCCTPGESVTRGPALARSCAPYFSPARLGITEAAWKAHWSTPGRPRWLLDMASLRPDTLVPVGELLRALAALPEAARNEARAALLQTAVDGYGRDATAHLGTGIRYKTYSWHRSDGSAFGGAAGWLADGTPFWFGARGSSRSALSTWAPRLAAALPAPRWRDAHDASCVDVDFFTRYPIRAVWKADEPVRAKPGELRGRYRIEFDNGNWLAVASRGELVLGEDDGNPSIGARLTVNDYVARVIEREGSAEPVQAARALAVAARSYLVQNAHVESGCWHIADSTRTQRVSPNPPRDAALAAAWFSDGMVLTGATVRYHHDEAGPDRMSWRDAVAQAKEGRSFEAILAAAYPRASLTALDGTRECTRLPDAEQWLAQAAAGWNRRLRGEPGFEPPQSPVVCALAEGNPYSDQQRIRIYVRGWRSLNDRMTLAHEYVHLALRFHPNGADEAYVERLARQLIEG
jgi:uncharacterized protein YfaQ (DUF2300 family)